MVAAGTGAGAGGAAGGVWPPGGGMTLSFQLELTLFIVPKILDWSEIGKEYRITLKEGRKILSASWYILVSKSKIRAQEETSQIKPSPITSTDVIDISDQVSSIKRFFEPKMDEYGYYGKGIFAIDSKDPKLQKERKMNKGERR
jgi:hypothetical protein